LRETAGDILKLGIFLWFGFYFKDYAQRRSSAKSRRRDNLQMSVLLCLFFGVLFPWYVFILSLFVSLAVYRWEMRDIRTDEKASVFEATWTVRAHSKEATANRKSDYP
jgi:hypothetical protein